MDQEIQFYKLKPCFYSWMYIISEINFFESYEIVTKRKHLF